MKKYPAYKDSGVDWLGEIPEHWETKRSKFLWFETTNLSEDGNEQLLSVSQYDGVKTNKNQSRSENLIGYKKVCKDNLVTNIMLAWLGGLGISNFDGVVSPAYSIYQASNEILPRFAHYLYRTKIYLDEFARRSSGVVPSRWRMYTDDFGEVRTVLPPKPEQEAIAHFLDDTCEKLDKVVAQKEKMMALLKERKQALIQKAVTRGLDENVDFKDSGVDWIGEIPVGWEVKKLKHLLKIRNGLDYKKVVSPSGFPVYGSGGIFAFASSFLFEGKSILFGRKGTIDKPLLVKGKFWTVDTMFCAQPTSINDLKFIYYSTCLIPFNFYKTSTAIPSMTQFDLNNSFVSLPPIKKQEQIVDYIDIQSQKIDQAVSQQEQAIVKLKEYKASLIDSCVLGKIKVS